MTCIDTAPLYQSTLHQIQRTVEKEQVGILTRIMILAFWELTFNIQGSGIEYWFVWSDHSC